jgi:hypothetical protein
MSKNLVRNVMHAIESIISTISTCKV